LCACGAQAEVPGLWRIADSGLYKAAHQARKGSHSMASFTLFINHLLNILDGLTICYFFLGNGAYTCLMIGSLVSVLLNNRRVAYQGLDALNKSIAIPPVTIIIPAYNEEAVITGAVKSALRCTYPGMQVLVVEDGSTDGTMGRLREAFNLQPLDLIYRPLLRTQPVETVYVSKDFPALTVLQKNHGGKPDALNAGINFCRTPYFSSTDADTILEPDALLRLMHPILCSAVQTVACAGIVRVLNGSTVKDGSIVRTGLPSRWLERFQVVEYLRTFLFGRTGWDLLGGTLVVSGALAVFQKQAVIEAGGFSSETVTEDMEIIVRLQRLSRESKQQIHVAFITDPVCWTECPSTFQMLARQRRRWHLGLCQTLWRNSEMLFSPRYGVLGLLSFPFYLYVEALGALVEWAGYVSVPVAFLLHLAIPAIYIPLVILSLAYAAFLSTGAVLLEELTYRRYPGLRDFGILLLTALLENFGYRQLVLFFRLQGMGRFLIGFKHWEPVSHSSSPGQDTPGLADTLADRSAGA
jgi:cellulose synthase/poly-beta-1,6-N-acetylglucosamine synthase-like glycosyltransferase